MLLTSGALFGGCGITAAEDHADEPFVARELVIGSAERQTVLTGFLTEASIAQLIVLHPDDNGERHLRLYALADDGWKLAREATLGDEVSFVDVVRIAGRDRLILSEPGRLRWFDPDSGSVQDLLPLAVDFDPPRANEVPHVDLGRDVNGDGREDLVVPRGSGFAVLVQEAGGGFADPVEVGASADLSRILGADGYRYDPWSQSRVHEVDHDLDGRVDLVFWNEDHFEVHLQDERGLFATAPITFTTEVPFDSDDPGWLTAGTMEGRVLHSLADLNGDGVADLVVATLDGDRPSKKRSSYEVYFGAASPEDGTVFAKEVGVTFHSKNKVLIGMERVDLDGDDQVDLVLNCIDVRFLEGSLWKRLKGAMGDDLWLDLEFYRQENGRYPHEPNATRRIALDGPPSHREPGSVPLDLVLRGKAHVERRNQKGYRRAFNMVQLLGDLTGDGRLDLLIESTHRGLPISIGVPGPSLFAGRSNNIVVDVPADEEYVWLVDLDQDGKQDILLHHPFTQRDAHGGRKLAPGSEPHRVTTLIAR